MSEPTTAYVPADFDLHAPGAVDRLISFHRARFGGYVMEEGAGGNTGDQGGQGGQGGQPAGTDSGDGGQSSGQLDLSSLTADDLKAHPEFQSTVNNIVSERLKREKATWQQKLEDEQRTAQLQGEEKWNAEKQQFETKLSERDQKLASAHRLVAQTRAQVLAVSEGGRADRATAIANQADLSNAVDEDGNVDEAALKAAVTKVLRDYPEWKTDPQGGQSTSTRSGGEIKTGADGKPVITKSQVEAMSTEERVRRWDEIEAAMEDGRFDPTR